jgi:uncharacterized protein
MPETDVHDTHPMQLKAPLLIGGFVGPGLVGTITASYLIETLGLHEIAHVRSAHIPPATVFIAGKLRHPFRIYGDDKGKLCVTICEVTLPIDGLYHLARALLDWAESKHATEVVVLDGVPQPTLPAERPAFCAAEEGRCQQLARKGIPTLKSAFIGGMPGSLLNEALTRNIVGVALLTPAIANLPDPGGAAALVSALKQAYGLNVSTEPLLAKAKEIEGAFDELAQKYTKAHEAEQRDMPRGLYG